MIAIRISEYQKSGCPNCGCDFNVRDFACLSSQPGVTCKHCGLHYYLVSDDANQYDLSETNVRKDENGKYVMELPIIIPHPRRGKNKWRWEAPDECPEYGEYANSRGVGYDLSFFIKSKKAGERILQMVKDVLQAEKPTSYLDYRESERTWIQFKFKKEEFDLERLDSMVTDNKNVLTKEILEKCKVN